MCGCLYFGYTHRRSGLSTAAACHVAIALASESLEAATAVKALLDRCQRQVEGTAETWRTVVETHKHTLDFYNGKGPKRLLKITKVHYNKLRALWQGQSTHTRPVPAQLKVCA